VRTLYQVKWSSFSPTSNRSTSSFALSPLDLKSAKLDQRTKATGLTIAQSFLDRDVRLALGGGCDEVEERSRQLHEREDSLQDWLLFAGWSGISFAERLKALEVT
jgi:hypothetical protein